MCVSSNVGAKDSTSSVGVSASPVDPYSAVSSEDDSSPGTSAMGSVSPIESSPAERRLDMELCLAASSLVLQFRLVAIKYDDRSIFSAPSSSSSSTDSNEVSDS